VMTLVLLVAGFLVYRRGRRSIARAAVTLSEGLAG
jgi:hypothetical protein